MATENTSGQPPFFRKVFWGRRIRDYRDEGIRCIGITADSEACRQAGRSSLLFDDLPGKGFLSGPRTGVPARSRKRRWIFPASSGSGRESPTSSVYPAFSQVHPQRRPRGRSLRDPCCEAAGRIASFCSGCSGCFRYIPSWVPPGAKLWITICRVSNCACTSGGRIARSWSVVIPALLRPFRLFRKRVIMSMVSCSCLFA